MPILTLSIMDIIKSQNEQSNAITYRNIEIDVVRKGHQNMHLAVHPPHGRIIRLVSHPKTDEEVRLALVNG
jgi:hypothetical protein